MSYGFYVKLSTSVIPHNSCTSFVITALNAGAAHTRKLHGADGVDAEEETVIATIYRLFCLLPRPEAALTSLQSSKQGVAYLRLLSKFTEAGMEKIDRLVQLFIKYRGRVAAAEAATLAAVRAGRDSEDEDDEDDEALAYERQLDAGLLPLQRLSAIIAMAVTHGDDSIAFSVRAKLLEQGESLVAVAGVLEAQVERGVSVEGLDDTAATRVRGEISQLGVLLSDLRTAAGINVDDRPSE